MANLIGDTDSQRFIDRIKANAWREAMENGASFINRKWISKKLHRSERWVTDNWKKGYDNCDSDFSSCGRKQVLSQESQNLVFEEFSGKRSCSNHIVSRQILLRRGKNVSSEVIRRLRKNKGFNAYHVLNKPIKTEKNREDRLWYCDFLRNWQNDDFLHLAASDEFFIWTFRKANHQNDRIWAREIGDIEEDERYRGIVQASQCIGIFLLFTCKKMMWVIKNQGQSWDGQYFRDVIIPKVVDFLQDDDNVLDVSDVLLLHDKAPGWTANSTQDLLRRSPIDFLSKSEYPGNSPDLNPTEDLGAILKNRVEDLMLKERGVNRYSRQTLMQNLQIVLQDLESDSELFENLLLSYTDRLSAVRSANGGQTSY